jgi:hypothetical protein
MSDLRVLTYAELDLVSGGAMKITSCGGGMSTFRGTTTCESPVVKLVEEIVVDILKVLEGNTGRQKAYTA